MPPGGVHQFGWCVADGTADGIRIRRSGLASHALGAFTAIVGALQVDEQPAAAGIDSPLFWVTDGDRAADKCIRRAMKTLGAPNVGGTVQQVNSLRGACLSQGILVAHLLRQRWPHIRVSESHPKALLWLLKVATVKRSAIAIKVRDIPGVGCEPDASCGEHERDAALGALAANAMLTAQAGWRDLRLQERDAFEPISPVEYWMPMRVNE